MIPVMSGKQVITLLTASNLFIEAMSICYLYVSNRINANSDEAVLQPKHMPPWWRYTREAGVNDYWR